jgi:hypothetical protein
MGVLHATTDQTIDALPVAAGESMLAPQKLVPTLVAAVRSLGGKAGK